MAHDHLCTVQSFLDSVFYCDALCSKHNEISVHVGKSLMEHNLLGLHVLCNIFYETNRSTFQHAGVFMNLN